MHLLKVEVFTEVLLTPWQPQLLANLSLGAYSDSESVRTSAIEPTGFLYMMHIKNSLTGVALVYNNPRYHDITISQHQEP